MSNTPTGRIKDAGHIMRMYGGVVDLKKITWLFPKFDYHEIEARCSAFYGYDPRNYFGQYATRVRR